MLMSDAVSFIFRLICIIVLGVLIVAAAVQAADLTDKAYHSLVMMMRHDSNQGYHR